MTRFGLVGVVLALFLSATPWRDNFIDVLALHGSALLLMLFLVYMLLMDLKIIEEPAEDR